MKKKDAPFKTWHGCHKCNLKMGGKVPKWGHRGITVMGGTCAYCGKPGTLVPHSDYDWPQRGQKAIFD